MTTHELTNKYGHRPNPRTGDGSGKGRELKRLIGYVYSGDPRFSGHGGLQTGWVVIGLVER